MATNMNEIIEKPWININDLRKLYPCGRKACYEMFKVAHKRALEDNYFVPTCRPPVVPTEVVLELYPLGKKKGY